MDLDMVIVWAIVIAVALLIEFVTYEFYSTWFAGGGLIAMILASVDVSLEWQIIVFVVSSLALLLSMRPFVKRFIRTESVPTNADSNIGKVVKLASAIVEGKGTIKISDVVWTAVCAEPLEAGVKVVITEISGNKYIVKKAEEK